MSQPAHLFTSITANYLPKARVLAQSAKRQPADIRFHLLLCDDYPAELDPAAEPFDSIINVTELPVANLESWLFGHTVVEMCTAVKAMGFLEIARRFHAEKVFYFDPDMAIMSGLDRLIERLDHDAILLTPHQTEPEQSLDAVVDNEICSLKHGVFNLGFLGARTDGEGLQFLQWWAERLRYFCHDDIPGGLFTDQRWIDLAPAFFEKIAILREPIYNVATWNLTHRQAAGSLQQGITINGQPLSFYHFSGFDGGAQEIMLKKYAPAHSVLFDLRRWYIEECQRLGQEELGKRRCRYDTFDNGERITKLQRVLYRSRVDLQRAFPNPYRTGDIDRSYYHWYRANTAGDNDDSLETDATLRAQWMDARRELDLIYRSRSWRLAQVFARIFKRLRRA
ncbi:MAG TPA: glycosyl transferase [Candidatus Competibacteraceae bacterium]|nr:MAG: glycosyl transferase [Candidatus Competibacteraceae bacterium]HQA25299.1 glycosyl transferase [Candidatus Competibacteraceae bacterium]